MRFQKSVKPYWMAVLACVLPMACAGSSWATQYKVLAVMSYDNSYEWNTEVEEGVMSAFKDKADVAFFHMNTKNKREEAQQKAAEAYALFEQIKPDGVIAADDNAQTMFVIPYLKDKVKTPVVFCGVNASPGKLETYGYPASNVTGVMEHEMLAESISFMKQLVPNMKTLGFLCIDSEIGQAVSRQIKAQEGGFEVPIVEYRLASTMKDALAAAEAMSKTVDALYLPTLAGIPRDDGSRMTEQEAYPAAVKSFGKPVTGDTYSNVKHGALCAVVKTGQEQGSLAAEMLLKAMGGTPVSQIPITRNRVGRRVLNVDTVKSLGITPSPALIRGVEIVKTER